MIYQIKPKFFEGSWSRVMVAVDVAQDRKIGHVDVVALIGIK